MKTRVTDRRFVARAETVSFQKLCCFSDHWYSFYTIYVRNRVTFLLTSWSPSFVHSYRNNHRSQQPSTTSTITLDQYWNDQYSSKVAYLVILLFYMSSKFRTECRAWHLYAARVPENRKMTDWCCRKLGTIMKDCNLTITWGWYDGLLLVRLKLFRHSLWRLRFENEQHGVLLGGRKLMPKDSFAAMGIKKRYSFWTRIV